MPAALGLNSGGAFTTEFTLRMLESSMKNTQQATHQHTRAGAVVVLESAEFLAKVLIPGSGDEYWVKVTDLTPLIDGVIPKGKVGKKQVRKSVPAIHHARVVPAA